MLILLCSQSGYLSFFYHIKEELSEDLVRSVNSCCKYCLHSKCRENSEYTWIPLLMNFCSINQMPLLCRVTFHPLILLCSLFSAHKSFLPPPRTSLMPIPSDAHKESGSLTSSTWSTACPENNHHMWGVLLFRGMLFVGHDHLQRHCVGCYYFLAHRVWC